MPGNRRAFHYHTQRTRWFPQRRRAGKNLCGIGRSAEGTAGASSSAPPEFRNRDQQSVDRNQSYPKLRCSLRSSLRSGRSGATETVKVVREAGTVPVGQRPHLPARVVAVGHVVVVRHRQQRAPSAEVVGIADRVVDIVVAVGIEADFDQPAREIMLIQGFAHCTASAGLVMRTRLLRTSWANATSGVLARSS